MQGRKITNTPNNLTLLILDCIRCDAAFVDCVGNHLGEPRIALPIELRIPRHTGGQFGSLPVHADQPQSAARSRALWAEQLHGPDLPRFFGPRLA
jgi:hypothetical protein